MPPVANSSHRPYVSRRKRRRSSSFTARFSPKVTLGLLGLLIVALVASLGIIAFSINSDDETASSYQEAALVPSVAAPALAEADSNRASASATVPVR